ncbi:MAG: hypothetical protein HYS62_00985 [Candidatus Aenigmarchaeota archaeon]|nr:hypothetical protein [Candidatus Aenigmarchaeota archaeon]
MYYNIHNLIGVESNIRILPEFFEGKPKKIDLVIKQGDFSFDKSESNKLGLKFSGGNDTLYLEYPFYGKSIQKLLLKNIKGDRTEFYFTKFTHSMFGVAGLVTYLLQLKLLQKGCTFVHAGGLTKEGKALLITAWSEMGKSSTIFGLAGKDFGVLGDDAVIVGKDGNVYSFPHKAGIFFHSKNIENLKLSMIDKSKVFMKYLIAKLPPLHLYIDPNLRIDLSKLLPIEKSGKLGDIYFLEWGNGVAKVDKKTAINKMVSATLHSLLGDHFTKETFFAYSYLNNFDPQFVERGMVDVLNKVVKNCKIIRSTKKDFYKYFLTKYGGDATKNGVQL